MFVSHSLPRIAACILLPMALIACTAHDDTSTEIAALPVLGELPEFDLVDEDGASFTREELAGELWIADFIFTRCPSTCPVQTAMMKRLQDALTSKPYWSSTRLVSFSVDPGYDTPEVLTEYAESAGAEPGKWKFVTGTRDAIWALSIDGFKLAAGEPAEGDGPLFHSSKFILVDAHGQIRGYYDGLTPEGVDALVQDLDAHAEDLLG